MTYDPYKFDQYSNEPPRDLDDYSGGVAILVGALLLAALGGFIYLYSGPSDQNLATNDAHPPIIRQSTTGSSADMPRAAQPRIEPKAKPLE